MWGAGHGPNGFFGIANRYAGLDAKNDPLVKIDEVVPWEALRPRLEAAWRKPAGNGKTRKTRASSLAAVRETARHVELHANRVGFRGAPKSAPPIRLKSGPPSD